MERGSGQRRKKWEEKRKEGRKGFGWRGREGQKERTKKRELNLSHSPCFVERRYEKQRKNITENERKKEKMCEIKLKRRIS
jgi:hypothetical protein